MAEAVYSDDTDPDDSSYIVSRGSLRRADTDEHEDRNQITDGNVEVGEVDVNQSVFDFPRLDIHELEGVNNAEITEIPDESQISVPIQRIREDRHLMNAHENAVVNSDDQIPIQEITRDQCQLMQTGITNHTDYPIHYWSDGDNGLSSLPGIVPEDVLVTSNARQTSNFQPYFFCNTETYTNRHHGNSTIASGARLVQHPEYHLSYDRMQTFFGYEWPSAVPNQGQVVRSGFFYIGNDMIRCYRCGGTLHTYSFVPDDDPVAKHRQYNPDCN